VLPDKGTEVSFHGSDTRDGAVYKYRLVFIAGAEGLILSHRYTVSPKQFTDFYGKFGECGRLLVGYR